MAMKMLGLRTIYGKNKTRKELISQIEGTPVNTNALITEFDIHTWKDIDGWGPTLKVSKPSELFELMKKSVTSTDKITNRLIYISSCNCAAVISAVRGDYDIVGSVAITSAGLADRKIVDEAGLTVILRGYKANFFNDIGVNGLHRTLDQLDEINKCGAIISVQGFEGALPVVLAGLTDLPIISVPTSTGYGVSAKGYTALNTALSSCTPGITAVNIDNGFGAGESAARILNTISSK